MTTVALVGFAENTRDAVRKSRADEIWSLNWAYKYDFLPRIDRLFEMHPVWLYGRSTKPEHRKMRDHWLWLQQPRPYPVYMLDDVPGVPGCIRYPIEAVTSDLFGKLVRGDNLTDFYGSTADYMLALATHERVEAIELYGIEMGSQTEYRYQRETLAYFIGAATARGIRVRLEPESVLLKVKRYGYNGAGTMISRQDLERLLHQFTEQHNNNMARLQYLEGQSVSSSDPDIIKKRAEARDASMVSGVSQQLLGYLINEIDLEEPTYEITNPIQKIEV